MSRITLQNLTSVETLNREAMAQTLGGLINFNEPGIYRVRRYCYLFRTRFGLRRYCFLR